MDMSPEKLTSGKEYRACKAKEKKNPLIKESKD